MNCFEELMESYTRLKKRTFKIRYIPLNEETQEEVQEEVSGENQNESGVEESSSSKSTTE